MKYIKFFALAVSLSALVACNDDKKEYNSAAEVMVEMADAQISVKENVGIFNVPVEVTGNPNGIVTVTVKVEESGVNGAKEATLVDGKRTGNYVVTSKTINIPSDDKTANIQINAIDDDDENEDRSFIITIEKAEGAKIDESKKTTIVTIKDNDKVPYDKLQGAWTLAFKDIDSGALQSFDVTITGYEEGTPNYGKVLLMEGMLTNPPYIKPGGSSIKLNYFYDEGTEECVLEMPYGQVFGDMNVEAVGDQYAGAKCVVYGLTIEGDQLGLVQEGYTEGNVDAQRRLVTFTPDDIVGFCFNLNGSIGLFAAGYEMKLTRK